MIFMSIELILSEAVVQKGNITVVYTFSQSPLIGVGINERFQEQKKS